MDRHVNSVCSPCYCHIRALRHIRPSLNQETAANIGRSVVSSRLDYCNSLMYGISRANMKKLQWVQNALIRVICSLEPRNSVSGARRDLHWLPIEQRIIFKIAVLTFNCRRRSAPSYICVILFTTICHVERWDLATGWPLRYHELRRLQRSALLASQRQPFGMTFFSNWDSLPISMDLKLNLKLIFLLRVNHSHLAFWIFLDF